MVGGREGTVRFAAGWTMTIAPSTACKPDSLAPTRIASGPSPHASARTWYAAALGTVAAWVLFRLVYLVWWCPFDLAPDEAHYWDWSRQLDWCYYSKGPLVAWLIYLGESLCGPWLKDVHGTTMPAVRLPSSICGGLLAFGVFVLTWQITAFPSLAFLTMLAVMLTPHVSVLSTLMTIDSPFLCLWQWSLVAAYYALGLNRLHRVQDPASDLLPPAYTMQSGSNSSRWVSWLILGLLIGLGVLAKPTMLLFPACLMLFLVMHRGMRALLSRPAVWCALGLAALVGAGPILWWNAQHDWVTFRHLFAQAALVGPIRWRPWGWLEYLGVQSALLLGTGMVAWLAASLWAVRSHQPASGFLLAFSWPVFVVFAGFSFRTPIQPNWPVSAYLAAIPLTACWLRATWFQAGTPRLARLLLWPTALIALLLTIHLHVPHLAYHLGLLPTLARLTGRDTEPQWPRRFDPTCRLLGWREIALALQHCRELCQRSRFDPILAATPYGTAAELAFYLPDQPRVYCLNRANGMRYTQYDLWRPNPLADPQRFTGRIFLCVGPLSAQARAGFASVTLLQTVVIHRYGCEIAREYIYLAQDFRGFPEDGQLPRY
ncbi:hypothetical protein HRbin36_02104 [bacterium HR36]|nr:hypothetical protein HRbin36_02104 [bacterium HR36]